MFYKRVVLQHEYFVQNSHSRTTLSSKIGAVQTCLLKKEVLILKLVNELRLKEFTLNFYALPLCKQIVLELVSQMTWLKNHKHFQWTFFFV